MTRLLIGLDTLAEISFERVDYAGKDDGVRIGCIIALAAEPVAASAS